MKPAAGLLGFGVALLLLQGVLTTFLPARYVPELSLLVVIAMGLVLRSAMLGLVAAFLLGCATDVLSGSVPGMHALLRVALLLTVLFAGRHLSLRGGPTVVVFAAGLSAGNAVVLELLANLVAPVDGGFASRLLPDLLPQLLANGLAAPFVVGLANRIAAWLGDEDGRRLLRFDTRSFPA